MKDRPLSYWVAVARMGFEDDFNRLFEEQGISRAELAQRLNKSAAYVSKLLNGTAGNFQLRTMAEWARAIGAIVQIRVIKEEGEAVRVVDYDTAGTIDDMQAEHEISATDTAGDVFGRVLPFRGLRVARVAAVADVSQEVAQYG